MKRKGQRNLYEQILHSKKLGSVSVKPYVRMDGVLGIFKTWTEQDTINKKIAKGQITNKEKGEPATKGLGIKLRSREERMHKKKDKIHSLI